VIVLDASVVAELLLGLPRAAAIREYLVRRVDDETEFAAPHLLDAEVGQVLRRLVLRQELRMPRAQAALEDLAALPILRHPHLPLLPRAFEPREHTTVYDALYVALAEALEAVLLTADRGIARLPGLRTQVEWISA